MLESLYLYYELYKQTFQIIVVLFITAGLLYWVNTSFNHKKYKNILLISLWSFTILYFFKMVNEFMWLPSNFESVKEVRYQKVIKKLTDIRDSELAFRSVNGEFVDNWDSLVKFIEVDSFTLTQRRDSSIIDKELTKRYGGVKTYKDIVIVDTLGFASVRDSLFGFDDRYKKMMYVPYAEKENTMFELRSGFFEQNDLKIPVFEVMVKKSVVLYDQDENLMLTENLVQGVNGVNGDALRVGSMNEVNTNGNWPKNYKKEE
jgi:hypothetical protein